jgi:hypothetical protein
MSNPTSQGWNGMNPGRGSTTRTSISIAKRHNSVTVKANDSFFNFTAM